MDIISFLELINIYVIENYLISLMVFICLLIFYTSLSIPGNLFLFLFSGFIFGFYLGYIVNIISITKSITFQITPCENILASPLILFNFSDEWELMCTR